MTRQGSYGTVVFRNAKEIIEREDVKSFVKRIREEWSIPTNGFKREEKYTKWYAYQVRRSPSDKDFSCYSLFLSEIQNYCKQLKLPSHWKIFFNRYITHGKIINSTRLRSGRSVNTPKIHNGKSKQKIFLEIEANTNLGDVRSIWSEVKRKQKQLPDYDKSRTKRKLRRDLHALSKSNKGIKK